MPPALPDPLDRQAPAKPNTLTRQVLIALAAGVLVGVGLHAIEGPAVRAALDALEGVADLFLRLVKMVIAPLVLATLAGGLAHMRDGLAARRLFVRALGWFLVASLVSLGLGLVMVNLFQPGLGVDLPQQAAANAPLGRPFQFGAFLAHLAPTSAIKAMADNEVLQIVVFAIFVGFGLGVIGEAGRPLSRGLDALAKLMLVITGYVMRLAPLAVFAAVAGVVAAQGVGILGAFARFIGAFYGALALLWLILLGVGLVTLGPATLHKLLREIREPFLVAFSTASSEASYPAMLDALNRAGVRPGTAALVLPLGYAFNLDGSMMYCAFASLFLAQAYGIDLSLGQQALMLLLLMVTSKGVAGVPRASLVVVAAVLPYFNIPAAGIALIIAVDHLLDMGRTATNVVGNGVAIAALDRWEPATPRSAAILAAETT